MDKQEIMNNLELIFANMTEDEKKEYMKKNDKAKEIFLGLKLIQIKYGKLEEEKLKSMPQKEREKFEKEKAFDEKVNSVIEEVYDKRTEKFERQKDQGQDENIDEYVDLCNRAEKEAKARNLKTMNFNQMNSSHNGGKFDE